MNPGRAAIRSRSAYEESRRGAPDSEHVRHPAYEIPAGGMDRILEDFGTTADGPDRGRLPGRCTRRFTPTGGWDGLCELTIVGSFPVEYRDRG